MTDADGIHAFLRARYDEIEQAARAAKETRRPWYFDHIDEAAKPFVDLALDADQVLADLDSKRAILDLHAEASAATPNGWDDSAVHWAAAVEDVLRLLALPFATHPDYQESWKP